MTDAAPFACSLGTEDLVRRQVEDRALAARLTSHRWEGRRKVVLAFPAHAAGLVDRFVAEESACCPFFGFCTEDNGDEVRLQVVVPEGGEPMLHDLVTWFVE